MRAACCIAVLACLGCGRIAFDPVEDAGLVDGPRVDLSACPATYVANGDNRYRIVSTPMLTWPDAFADCNDDLVGATVFTHLAVFETDSEGETLREATGQTFWFGLTDVRMEDQFEWITGVPLTYVHWDTSNPTEPSSGDCVELENTGWDAYACRDKVQNFVCECDGSPPLALDLSGAD